MHAVVTGSAGFIGTHLATELIARGHRVTGIDREPMPRNVLHENFTLDLADPPCMSKIRPIMAGADVIFHLAARPGVRGRGRHLEEQRHRDNVVATANVLQIAPRDTHVVATSSSSVYGGARMRDGLLIASRETDGLRPVGGYASSKVRMERLCAEYRNRGGSITVARPFTVAGERQRPDMAFAIWLEALRRREPIRLFGSGASLRDITYVGDVVEGLIRAAERRVNAEVNLGSGVAHRLDAMARTVLAISGLDGDMIHEPVLREEVGATLADTRRCRELLGFVPETDLSVVVGKVVAGASSPALAPA